jgi:hypothetical protein
MAAWKVMLVGFLAFLTLGLAFASLIVPLALTDDDGRWIWFAGLLGGCIVIGTLFILFLRAEDRRQLEKSRRGGR